MVSILKGSILFLSNLIRKIKITECEIDFLWVSSYLDNKNSGGKVKILKDLTIDIKNHDVLIVEDIIEIGYTLAYVSNIINEKILKV